MAHQSTKPSPWATLSRAAQVAHSLRYLLVTTKQTSGGMSSVMQSQPTTHYFPRFTALSIATMVTGIVLGAVLISLAPTTQSATSLQDRQMDGRGHFTHPADQNADRQISRDEATDFARQRFAKLDSDDNGYLDNADLAGQRRQCPKKGRRLLRRMDRDQDGQVTTEEMVLGALERHQKIDGDGDGQVSAEERYQHRKMRHQQRSERFFEEADSNGDGQLSHAELRNAMERRHRHRRPGGTGAHPDSPISGDH